MPRRAAPLPPGVPDQPHGNTHATTKDNTAQQGIQLKQSITVPEGVKPEVEEQQGKKYTKFKALKYKTQMVAGTIHYVKVSVGNGKCIHLQILVPLDGPKPMLLGTQPEKTEDDEIEYFP
ncbi:hypothetical protein GDO78_015575 [Eleutherodactylus coqui]|uniref:Cystatin domain-containing protein n=1 Tax=Eleutherodactylus coqui TaxID=57060 RepID=A0A8J6JP31_ELECQ|nr:hypothetical protein GDO78_015575 [Eleutherodactylus coqui]